MRERETEREREREREARGRSYVAFSGHSSGSWGLGTFLRVGRGEEKEKMHEKNQRSQSVFVCEPGYLCVCLFVTDDVYIQVCVCMFEAVAFYVQGFRYVCRNINVCVCASVCVHV